MERLKGIGVSGGLAIGPALVAIQRTQVIRFPIAPDRVAVELRTLLSSGESVEGVLRRLRSEGKVGDFHLASAVATVLELEPREARRLVVRAVGR